MMFLSVPSVLGILRSCSLTGWLLSRLFEVSWQSSVQLTRLVVLAMVICNGSATSVCLGC